MPIRLQFGARHSLQPRTLPVCHKSGCSEAALGVIAQALLTYLRDLKDTGTITKDDFFQLVEKSMDAMAAGGQKRSEPVWSRTITTIINTARKLVIRDGTCIGGIVEELINLSQKLQRFRSTVALAAGQDVTQLDVSIVSILLIQCSDTTIATYLTSVMADIYTCADLETKMIARYSKHHRQVMWETIELAQGEIETEATFFDRVEMLNTQVAGIIDNFLQGGIIKALRDLYCIQLAAFEATRANPDGTPIDALSFSAIKAYLIR